jgi:hypothetical protein
MACDELCGALSQAAGALARLSASSGSRDLGLLAVSSSV